LGNQLNNIEVGKSLPGRPRDFLNKSDPALRVNERTCLFTPTGRRQNQVRSLSRLCRAIHVLHNEKIELFNDLVEFALVNPGVRRIRGNDPEPLDFSVCDCLDNLVVGPTVLSRNFFNAYSKELGDLFAIGRI
jgi:hypothetical protein